jgi:hypothetical protein
MIITPDRSHGVWSEWMRHSVLYKSIRLQGSLQHISNLELCEGGQIFSSLTLERPADRMKDRRL